MSLTKFDEATPKNYYGSKVSSKLLLQYKCKINDWSFNNSIRTTLGNSLVEDLNIYKFQCIVFTLSKLFSRRNRKYFFEFVLITMMYLSSGCSIYQNVLEISLLVSMRLSCSNFEKVLPHWCGILQKYTIFGGSDTHL